MPGFHPQGLVTGVDFLDRQEESEMLHKRLRLGQNTLLVAPRRFGKSSLIQETFRRLEKEATCLYVDLFPATSQREAAEAILTEIYRSTAMHAKRLLDWLTETFHRLGITIRHAPTGFEVELTGRPRERDDLPDALKAIGLLAEKKGQPVYIALDEFQRVLDWKESHRAIATLRSEIQQQTRTTYILSGSKKHVLLGLVEDPGQPFWQQLDIMNLEGIPIHEFATYAKKKFQDHDKTLTHEALRRVADWTRENPKRIQELLQGLLMEDDPPTPGLVDLVATTQIEAQRHLLRSLLDQIKSMQQIRLLQSLAQHKDEATVQIYGAAFIQESRLGSPGSIRSAVLALRDAGLLDDEHRFTDPYLKHHLAPTHRP